MFVDGHPYVSGAESRFNDRYAVVSALGAAGYAAESGGVSAFPDGAKWGGHAENNPAKSVRTGCSRRRERGGTKWDHACTGRIVLPDRKTRDEPYGQTGAGSSAEGAGCDPRATDVLNDLLADFYKSVGKGSADIGLGLWRLGRAARAT